MITHSLVAPVLEGPDFERDLAAARAGEPELLGRLLDRYRPYLLAIARQEASPQLGGKVGASDLVQDTLMRGLEHFSRFEGATPEQLAGWLRQILLNHVRNVVTAYGAEKRDVTREQPVDNRVAMPRGDSPSGVLLARERNEQFERALSRLPPELREVIEWRHRENMSFAQIAGRMGKSEDTARRVWARAIERMQDELQIDESSVG